MEKNSDRKKELLQIATKLFMKKGYKNTTMQNIADEMGIKKPSLYYYISSKEDLLKEIVDITMQQFLQGIEEIFFSDGTPVDKLERIVKMHIRLICENIDYFCVTLREINPITAKNFWPHVVALRDKYQNYLKKLIVLGQKEGYFRKDMNVHLVTLGLLGGANWLVRWYSPNGENTPEEIADEFIKLCFKGVLSNELDRKL